MTCSLNSFCDILRQIARAEKLLLFAVRSSGAASGRRSRPRSKFVAGGAPFCRLLRARNRDRFSVPKQGPFTQKCIVGSEIGTAFQFQNRDRNGYQNESKNGSPRSVSERTLDPRPLAGSLLPAANTGSFSGTICESRQMIKTSSALAISHIISDRARVRAHNGCLPCRASSSLRKYVHMYECTHTYPLANRPIYLRACKRVC